MSVRTMVIWALVGNSAILATLLALFGHVR